MDRLVHSIAGRTVLSIWAWFVLGIAVIAAVPVVAVIRVVTAPFDRGAYHAGLAFRKVAVMHQRLNPLWRFRIEGAGLQAQCQIIELEVFILIFTWICWHGVTL